MLLQIAYAGPLAWWTLFLPLWIGHGGHLLLVLSVLLNAVGLHRCPVAHAAATMDCMLAAATATTWMAYTLEAGTWPSLMCDSPASNSTQAVLQGC
jgi:hypothetical protein